MNMQIDISGDALALLEDFINGATGFYSKGVANALFYVEDALLLRAALLNKALHQAKMKDQKRCRPKGVPLDRR
jgi:hypothetical protein